MGEEEPYLEWRKERARTKVTEGFLPAADNWNEFRDKMINEFSEWEPLGLMKEGKSFQYYMLPFKDKSEYGIPNTKTGIRIGPKTGFLADRPGIYMIAVPEKETYIGESRNLEQRMDTHWRGGRNELKDVSEFAGLIIIKITGNRGEDMMRSDAFRCTLEMELKKEINGEKTRVDKWVFPSEAEIDELVKLIKEIMRLLQAYQKEEVRKNPLFNFMKFSDLDKSPIPSNFLKRVK